MSVQALGAVLDHSESTKGTRLTAVSLGNHADKYGIVFLSKRLIAEEAKLSVRAVTDCLGVLREDLGELIVVVTAHPGQHRPPLYYLRLPGMSGILDPDHPYFQIFGSSADLAPGWGADSSPAPDAEPSPEAGADSSPGPGEASGGGLVKKGAPRLYREPSFNQQQPPVVPQEGDTDLSRQLFDFWKQLTGRNGSTQFTPKRRKATKARLQDSTLDELRAAIAGCAASDWHQKRGKHANRDGKIEDDLALIFRNRDNVERFAKMAPGDTPTAPSAPITDLEKAVAVWDEAKKVIASSIPESTFNLWIAPLEAAGERDGHLVLIDSQGSGGWTSRYSALIREALEAGDSGYTTIELIDEKTLELEAA
jgi:hypothetical protein